MEQCKEFQFLGCLIKISVLNFSIELVNKPAIYDLLFHIAIYSLKNDNKYPSKMTN